MHPTRGFHWRTAGALTSSEGGGYPGPRSCAQPAAWSLPARHSAPRADTAHGGAEPSRRAASAPESPWPTLSGERGGSAFCASLLQPVSRWSWPNAGRKPPRSAARNLAVSRCPTLAARACAVRTGGRCKSGGGAGGGGTATVQGGGGVRGTAPRDQRQALRPWVLRLPGCALRGGSLH